MKYRSFKRLVVQLIPEETMSPGGIDLSGAQQSRRQQGLGKVLDGYLKNPDPNICAAIAVRPGDTVVFSLSAPHEGPVYFLQEDHIFALLND